jgi:hypothetical protein
MKLKTDPCRSFALVVVVFCDEGWWINQPVAIHPHFDSEFATMAKVSATVFAALVASSAAFAPQQGVVSQTALNAGPSGLYTEVGGAVFDPLSLAKLESIEAFPNMFPDKQFLQEAEIKHGRQAMLAWTGVWATTSVSQQL